MLGLFHLAQKSSLAGKLFLTYLPSLPSLAIRRFLNLKLAYRTYRDYRDNWQVKKTLQPYLFDMPLKVKVQSIFIC